MTRLAAALAILFALTACEETAKGMEQDIREGGQAINNMF